ncbi:MULTISPECIES: hypothetical protein [unclassified Bradyrhizobium]|uniref:hypothetical protein n=1 Tax=unclassified Bradyrhizobium TaxID=2631580 RepID=UPI002305F343|nr:MULTISPECIES: hypothetical protein [unclassified Bradyrhizobium]MDA9451285.1 hypothetical protein [Bradyrhizobium sp. CCBAU 21360]MDA9457665.1 hypothetical protein [Bradyrhizobium sp. CCBAU 21359]
MPDEVTKKVVNVLLPWTAELIPYRGRKLRTVHVCEGIGAELRTPAAHEARVAFRLSSGRSRRENHPSDGGVQILHCDDALWWPFSPFTDDVRRQIHRPSFQPDRNNGIDDEGLLRHLADGAWDLLGLRSFQGIDPFEDLVPYAELPIVRVWEKDNKKEMIALAQKRVADLLIWGGMAFVRAGEPVYVDPHDEFPGHSIANVGVDRTVDPTAKGLPFDVGGFRDAQRSFMRGRFRRADSKPAGGASARNVIEVFTRDAIRLDRAAVRLDAIYRAADRAIASGEDADWAEIRCLFAEVSARDPQELATSADRFDALVRFCRFAADREDLPEEMREIHRSFLSFETSEDASALGSALLAEEDDAALAGLGGSLS